MKKDLLAFLKKVDWKKIPKAAKAVSATGDQTVKYQKASTKINDCTQSSG